MIVITRPADFATGQCFIDDEVLTGAGVDDISGYRVAAGDEQLELDFWMEWN